MIQEKTAPEPDAAIQRLAENSGHVLTLTNTTIDQLAMYITDVICQVSPGIQRAN